jgi:hypothetical protein
VSADEALDQPPCDGRGEQGIAVGHGTDAGDELLGRIVLEQKSARSG